MNEMEQAVVQVISVKYPLKLHSAEAITGEMFRCRAGEQVYFARVSSYKSYEVQNEEVKLLAYLRKQGVGVSSVMASLADRLVESGSFPQTRYIVLFSAAPGIHLPRQEWNGEVFRRLDREIGKLHRCASRYEPQYGKAEHITDWSGSGEYQFLQSIPPEETLIRAVAQQVLQEVQAIPRNGENYGILHGDIWLENVLVEGEMLTIIDFQNCERHYYLYDLAVPLYSALEYSFAGQGNIRDYGQTLAENLLAGYLEEHTLAPEMLEYMPLLLRLKELFEYSQMHLYSDKEKPSEEQVRLFNLYRMRLEHNISAVQLDYAPLFRLAASAQVMRHNE